MEIRFFCCISIKGLEEVHRLNSTQYSFLAVVLLQQLLSERLFIKIENTHLYVTAQIKMRNNASICKQGQANRLYPIIINIINIIIKLKPKNNVPCERFPIRWIHDPVH